jgi:four helix bundle protein
MNNYKELNVWKYSILLAKDIFKLVKKFPRDEKFSTIDQIKRCTISISSNIAEGSGRNSEKEFVHFLAIAYGSSCELDSLLTVCKEVEYITENEAKDYSSRVLLIQKMIRSLQTSIKKRLSK